MNKSSECFTEWDDKYLKNEYGHIDIDVIQKKPGDRIEPEVMSFKKFLLRYIYVYYETFILFYKVLVTVQGYLYLRNIVYILD